ncbi:MAG TPA: glycoside hydrolase family 20 zincin-like fold domain-containing protein, partial [Bacillota bacterium]|nr:glycoside hydrolase family 20 zincin-like fold domain-containing protein [Bacillota bacterium]
MSKFMLPVIPAPTDLFLGTGNLVLDEGTAIVAPEPLQGIARYLQQVLLEESGLSLPIAPHGAGKAIRLSVKPDLTGIGSEGYLFTAGPAGVEIAATTEAGVFYGVQTLRQLLPLA